MEKLAREVLFSKHFNKEIGANQGTHFVQTALSLASRKDHTQQDCQTITDVYLLMQRYKQHFISSYIEKKNDTRRGRGTFAAQRPRKIYANVPWTLEEGGLLICYM